MTRTPIAAFAVLAVLAGGLTACSPGNGSPGASASASTDTQRALDIGRRFSQCARDHGYPNFPDPVIDDGDKLSYPNAAPDLKEQIRTIMEQVPECKAIMDESLSLSGNRTNQPPSAADLAKLKDYAKCMREHGIPDFPDPKADGTFPLIGTPLENEGKSERVLSAMDACSGVYDGKIITS